MTPEETRQAASLMIAHAEGEKIEQERKDGHCPWHGAIEPSWSFTVYNYRVKPKKPYIARIITWDSDRIMDDDAPVGSYVELTDEVRALLGDIVDD